jgi:hypothetical protein
MEAAVLALSPIQPPEAPSKHEALVTLAKYRADLERCPDDKTGNWHEAATTTWTAMLQIERMVAQLIDIRFDVAGSTAHEALDYAIDQLVEAAGTLKNEAQRRAEEDAPPYNSEDYWPRYRG